MNVKRMFRKVGEIETRFDQKYFPSLVFENEEKYTKYWKGRAKYYFSYLKENGPCGISINQQFLRQVVENELGLYIVPKYEIDYLYELNKIINDPLVENFIKSLDN